MEESDIIDLESILEFVGNAQKNIRKGSEVLKADHIVECGLTETDERQDGLSFFALCLQSSGVTGNPHEVRLSIDGTRIQGLCSCKAGSFVCKHIYIYKNLS